MICVKCGDEVPVLIGNTQFCPGCFIEFTEYQKGWTSVNIFDFTKWMLLDREDATLTTEERQIQWIASWLTCFYFAVTKAAPLAYPVLTLMRTVVEMANILEYMANRPEKIREFMSGAALYKEANKFAKKVRNQASVVYRDKNEGEMYGRFYSLLTGVTHPKYLASLPHKVKVDDLVPIVNITFAKCQKALDVLLNAYSGNKKTETTTCPPETSPPEEGESTC